MIAGCAHVLIVAAGHIAYPYLYTVLIALAYGLMLPAIAILHPRHAALRPSGAILGTICGTSAAVLGLAGSVNVDLQPAALFVLGMWWWTIGKLWAETEILPRELGIATAAIGALAIAGTLVAALNVGLTALAPGVPVIAAWSISQVVLGGWLITLGVTFWRTATGLPSR